MRKERRKKRIKAKRIWMILAILAIIISLIFIIRYNQQIKLETSFQDMLDEQNYVKALSIYHKVQAEATSWTGDTGGKRRYIEIQKDYEKLVADKTKEILARLERGEKLTRDDQAFIAGMQEVTGSVVTPYLNRVTENWLDQKITYSEWQAFLNAFKGFPNLKLSVENLLTQESELKVAAQKFKEVEALDIKKQWNEIWEAWSALTDDQEVGHFANHYALYRLQNFQDDLYKMLMSDVDLYMKQNRYYSAKIVLERLFDAFPNKASIQEKLTLCNEKLPAELITWQDSVECIAIKPLSVEISQARKGKSKYFAESELLSVKEFENLLNELYLNDYVLVSPNLYFNYPDNFSEVVVPKGKKPLILILESYQYSAAYQEAGTAVKLSYDKENQVFYSCLKRDDSTSDIRQVPNAISILETFIKEHDNFSFNGAKALIALNVSENLFGYTVNAEQLDHFITALNDLGLPISYLINMTAEEKEAYLNRERLPLVQLISGLQLHNYYFCNGSYSNVELNSLSWDEYQHEIDKWQETTSPFIGETSAFLFPNGSHVYADSEKLNYLIEKGYVNFYSQGEEAYNFMSETYIHFNYIPVNYNSLRHPDVWQLNRLVDSDLIIEDWRE